MRERFAIALLVAFVIVAILGIADGVRLEWLRKQRRRRG